MFIWGEILSSHPGTRTWKITLQSPPFFFTCCTGIWKTHLIILLKSSLFILLLLYLIILFVYIILVSSRSSFIFSLSTNSECYETKLSSEPTNNPGNTVAHRASSYEPGNRAGSPTMSVQKGNVSPVDRDVIEENKRVEYKLVPFVTIVALWTAVSLLTKLIRVLLKWKHVQDKNYAILDVMILSKSFRCGHPGWSVQMGKFQSRLLRSASPASRIWTYGNFHEVKNCEARSPTSTQVDPAHIHEEALREIWIPDGNFNTLLALKEV